MFKNTVLLFVLLIVLIGCSVKKQVIADNNKNIVISEAVSTVDIITGAENFSAYLPLLQDKKVGVVTNQTGIVNYKIPYSTTIADGKPLRPITKHLVDYLLEHGITVEKIYAPEHGFRGVADAGELILDGKDSKTGLPIISLYGDNKKPKPEQLEGIDIVLFDLQDVGARFYTYISSLHYVMEACAEINLPLIILDRPNPNGAIVDGPILEKEFTSFVGMHPIPVLHGMTIGEYGKMINGKKWLKESIQCELTVIPCLHYRRDMEYSLPIKPSPNLPNDQAINLYASLCFFEGTNVSVGRGTDKQFQIYGSPFLPQGDFSFMPLPNLGSKNPLHNNLVCHGEDLSEISPVKRLRLKWLIEAYENTADKSTFFTSFFTKLAGTKLLRLQIEQGLSEKEIRSTWEKGLEEFIEMRKPYLIYN